MLTAYLKGFGLGAALIIAIGAQNAFVLRQGLRRSHVGIVATICFLCDAVLIGLGAAGFGTLVNAYPPLTHAAALGGAAFLIWYGFRALRAAWKPGRLVAGTDGGQEPLRRAVLTALALSLLNPHVYLDTVVLLGGIAGQFDGDLRVYFALGAVTASAVWFYGLGYGARLLAFLFAKPAAWRVLDLFIALVMWAIAFSLLRPYFQL